MRMIKQKIVGIRVDRIDQMVLDKLVKSKRLSPGEIFRRALRQYAESAGLTIPRDFGEIIDERVNKYDRSRY